jgi:hypothetical protein
VLARLSAPGACTFDGLRLVAAGREHGRERQQRRPLQQMPHRVARLR